MSSGTVSPVLLSVVLVVRRHQAWVRPCLRSILDQAPADLDVVVVDDASPDHSARIIAEAVDGDPRVRTHRSDRPVGTAGSVRTGLELARGDYVWLVEAADLLLPGRVRRGDRRPVVDARRPRSSARSSATSTARTAARAGPRDRPVMRNRIVRAGAPPRHRRAAGRAPRRDRPRGRRPRRRRHRGAGRHPGLRAPRPSGPGRPAVD